MEKRLTSSLPLVPKEHPTIVQRFNAGYNRRFLQVPQGRPESREIFSIVPSRLGTFPAEPSVKTLGYPRDSLREKERGLQSASCEYTPKHAE